MSALYGINANNDATAVRQGAPGAGSTGDNVPVADKHTDDEAINEKPSSSPADTLGKDEEDEDSEMERRTSIVQALARSYSHASGTHPNGQNPFQAGEDSPLNPNSPNFNAREWAKSVVELVHQDGANFRSAGVCYQNLNVYGYGGASDYQGDVANVWLSLSDLVGRVTGRKRQRIDILRNFDGVVHKGEMLVVLGPPGAGCSTTLKTIAGELNGIYVDEGSYFNYQGMTAKEMHSHHRGEAIYTAEIDVHFPMLSVGDTLTFAARARQPRQLPQGLNRNDFADHLRDVVMAMFGISHTVNTRVGNEYIRGVSGGERKRVTISEAALSGAPLQCWDNSTRGLDSANAIEFCKTLRLQTELFNNTAVVSIYQSPQSAYDLFDKATVIYEGRQIFFGRADAAKQYFINLGFECPARQTTPDFLTSMTAPNERIVRDGFKGKVPRTPDEFATAWRNSAEYKALQVEIEDYKVAHPINGPDAEAFRASKQAQQAKRQRAKSPYTLSYTQQIQLCLWRGWLRLKGDPGITVGSLIGNFVMALIIGSVFFNLDETSSSFFQRGALLFFAVLMNAFASALEILALYAQRPIVEKHSRYALYHPSAEAISSMLCDMPYKIANTIVFNITLYFMTNLKREPGAFFFFILMSFVVVLVMSMIFRTIASATRSLFQALVPAAILILDLVIFTGFVIPKRYMLGWCKWLYWIDPIAYAFEAVVVNEFHNRDYTCNEFVPNPSVSGYGDVASENRVCSAVGAEPGRAAVNGDRYAEMQFGYKWENRWRNFGIVIAWIILFTFTYMVAAELVSEKKSKGEVLVYRRGHKPAAVANAEKKHSDPEAAMAHIGPVVTAERTRSRTNKDGGMLQEQTSVFQWHDVCYEVKIKDETRKILDNVDGWVKPGTLTALMGVSGAGKTTLLDCLADRTSMGVITGEMLVDGNPRDMSFQRKTGYVQQQDLHLQTSTVREALNFSALLRQPAHVPKQEKLDYVEQVIKLLDMEEYADAVVGVPGEGLNVEQRKRLTIGVELAAKPPLLLFVDEPTSGLDSQTSWAILDLLEKLTNAGQAILCTIHQPSAMLFQRFDRLLFLAKGGKTVYFGDIGENSKTMTSYFERYGGHACPPEANPAEWMLEVIGAAPGSHTELDWFQTWRDSPEYQDVQAELERIKREKQGVEDTDVDDGSYREFAAPFMVQLKEVLFRVFQQYWRTPVYIYSKAALCSLVALFIGFVFFRAPNSIQGLQNQMFAIFNLLTIFGQLVQQSMPQFVIQRSLYEVRERPSKVYSWKIFMLAQIIVELPWNSLMAVIMFFGWYYPVGLYNNAADAGQTTERGALMFLLLLAFLIFTATFSTMIIAGFETAEGGANVANLLFMLCLIFCGVLAPKGTLPGFWKFMYYVSPFTYLVGGMLATGVANTEVTCASNELVPITPPNGSTCTEYMGDYIKAVGGYFVDPDATSNCEFCTVQYTNTYLAGVNIDYADRWRNFGLLWVYIIFNMGAALFIYWLARMPKKSFKKKTVKKE
ncbi:probable ABC1 transport protein [Fusarium fujikuroi]|uniref:Probable ABC1 transport protein n=1 Tax=Gibberella fujikuroi (strain CBS 195.34 / IMI 58289 / NRRL A-6831) TaxID=1279085 RepID=S0E9C0_GIBF5|nr:probable ABC1 transport protein [Fusarium fujikuroi IMI 58289]KLO83889.1 putative ABC1 transport protein [Fusarium fujikuroi]KLP00834.1 putative ABC1 transport protein [Fusarium fujikuroi]KLP22216.1 putative ABC1 transport protein [Fusarium fujikuroi]CCT70367.1 probable ABC1 transport protein [Fusarium fujikuroi IMI 58289]SCN76445.1 probable ABC1 transport protein [Fusarium fujikuroi]